jgi:hypothetical protein
MIVDYLAQVNKGALVQLEGCLPCDLQAGGMHDAEVAEVVPAIPIDNHELRLPQLLIVGDDIVIAVALTYLELGEGAIHLDLKVAELVRVN